MRLIWQGLESPSDVDLAYGAGVRDMAISYGSFKRRVKKPLQGLERFPDDVRIYLYDNTAWDTGLTQEEHLIASQEYELFVTRAYDRVFAFTEYDCPILGKEWILERREGFYDADHLNEKLWVCWQPSYGPDLLRSMGESYPDVVIPLSATDDPAVMSALTSLKGIYSTRFHCFGMSMDRDRQNPVFSSHVMSTHRAALKHSELYVPDGRWLRRVPKERKEEEARAARSFIESLGCDADLLASGNSAEHELYTVRVFRWLETQGATQLLDDLSDRDPYIADQESRVNPIVVTDSGLQESGKNVIPLRSVGYAEPTQPGLSDIPVVLPTMSLSTTTAFQHDSDGRMVLSEVPLVRSSSVSLRQCSTCSLSTACPVYSPGDSCRFSLPVELKTREQMQAMTEAVLEMQAARVFFARYEEEVSGYTGQQVGKEMDRLAKLATSFAKLGESRETIKIEARSSSGGILSQLFGKSEQ